MAGPLLSTFPGTTATYSHLALSSDKVITCDPLVGPAKTDEDPGPEGKGRSSFLPTWLRKDKRPMMLTGPSHFLQLSLLAERLCIKEQHQRYVHKSRCSQRATEAVVMVTVVS